LHGWFSFWPTFTLLTAGSVPNSKHSESRTSSTEKQQFDTQKAQATVDGLTFGLTANRTAGLSTERIRWVEPRDESLSSNGRPRPAVIDFKCPQWSDVASGKSCGEVTQLDGTDRLLKLPVMTGTPRRFPQLLTSGKCLRQDTTDWRELRTSRCSSIWKSGSLECPTMSMKRTCAISRLLKKDAPRQTDYGQVAELVI